MALEVESTTDFTVEHVTCTYEYGAPWAGPYEKTYEYPWNSWTTQRKASVNEGKFIPNEYRVNPYQASREKYSHSDNFVTATSGNPAAWSYTHTDYGRLAAKPLCTVSQAEDPFDFSNLGERALVGAYAKVNKNEVGAGENIGEIADTLRMAKDPFKALRNFFSDSNHRNLGLFNKIQHYLNTKKQHGEGKWAGTASPEQAAEAAASSWLELRYGLLPLIYTAQDVMKLVNEKAAAFDKDQIRTARSTVKSSDTRNRRELWGYYKWQYDGMFTVSDELKATACVHYKLKQPPKLMDLLGLTPKYLPELGWELTSLSFVADWFIGIGDWLGSYRLKPDIEILGNTVSLKGTRRVTGKALATCVMPDQSVEVDTLDDCGLYLLESIDRLVHQELPYLPQLSLELPSVVRQVDALALIIGPTVKHIKRG